MYGPEHCSDYVVQLASSSSSSSSYSSSSSFSSSTLTSVQREDMSSRTSKAI
jgi:hypothetical protein